MKYESIVIDLTNGKEIRLEKWKNEQEIRYAFMSYHNTIKDRDTLHIEVEDREIVILVKNIISITMQ